MPLPPGYNNGSNSLEQSFLNGQPIPPSLRPSAFSPSASPNPSANQMSASPNALANQMSDEDLESVKSRMAFDIATLRKSHHRLGSLVGSDDLDVNENSGENDASSKLENSFDEKDDTTSSPVTA